jgi:hypothetical protein
MSTDNIPCISARFFLVLLLALFQVGCASSGVSEEKRLQRSIGSLLLYRDETFSYRKAEPTRMEHLMVFDAFRETYRDDIKDLSEEYRVQFFWTALWHIRFDGHTMHEFQRLVLEDCGDSFVKLTERYVSLASNIKSDKRHHFLMKAVLRDLTRLMGMEKNMEEKGPEPF